MEGRLQPSISGRDLAPPVTRSHTMLSEFGDAGRGNRPKTARSAHLEIAEGAIQAFEWVTSFGAYNPISASNSARSQPLIALKVIKPLQRIEVDIQDISQAI